MMAICPNISRGNRSVMLLICDCQCSQLYEEAKGFQIQAIQGNLEKYLHSV
jgi:hypothetical protein